MKAQDTSALRIYLHLLLIAACLFFGYATVYAQPKPPRPAKISVYNAQGIQFGAFANTSSPGTVTISSSGIRSSSGGIIRLNLGYTFNAAVYSIDAVPGTLITITYNGSSTMTGPIPNTPLTLTMGPASKSPTFTVPAGTSPASPLLLYVGGTLAVPANPTPGNYTGLYTITFIQQ